MTKVSGNGWLLCLVLSILFSMIMGFGLVWLGITRSQTAHSIDTLMKTVREQQVLHNKLEIEREFLLSPYELGRKAERLGMRPAQSGQIRRVE